jgi:hypothetical protein
MGIEASVVGPILIGPADSLGTTADITVQEKYT